jgi:hypothetical protein
MHPGAFRLARARTVVPFPRPAGKCLIVAPPVKGARTLASLRDGASATLDRHHSSRAPGTYQERAQTDRAAAPAAAPEKE